METQRGELASSIGLLILRLGIGGYLLTHGVGKLQMMLAGGFGKFGDPIGLGSGPSLVLVTAAEFFCALAVMAGLATRFAAAVIVISMSVAAFVAHGSDPWTMGEGARRFMAGTSKSWASREPALLYLIPVLALIVTGAGRFSIDGWIGTRRRDRRADAPARI